MLCDITNGETTNSIGDDIGVSPEVILELVFPDRGRMREKVDISRKR